VGVLAVYAVLLLVYGFALHPWLANWGTTDDERRMALPGDDLNAHPRWQTTRAITIDASADMVWAWLIQHGQDRAGFYSYDWLENLTGADIHNADEIRPDWQARVVGDTIPMARPDLLAGRLVDASALRVRIVEPGRTLVTTDAGGNVGAMVLIPVDAQTTRLVLRDRAGTADGGGLGHRVGTVQRRLVWDPMHFVMQRGMMLGIEARAEGRPNPPAPLAVAARVGWLAAGGAVLALFLHRRRYWPWLALPIVATLPALLSAGDADAALVGFLAVGITTLGAVPFGRRWWPPFALIGAGVLLVLLLAPDAYVAFGLIFDAIILGGVGWLASRRRRWHASPGNRRAAAAS
jgi:hypothetical protein